MPTVLTAGPFRVLILLPPREHGPAHVHVLTGKGQGEGEVVIALEPSDDTEVPWPPVRVREVVGMTPRDVVTAVRLVEAHRCELLRRWREIHGGN